MLLLMQSAESLRSRAEEAITCIQYMQDFAVCTDFAELPELFQDSSRLSQAAVRSRHALLMLLHLILLAQHCMGRTLGMHLT